MKNSSPLARAIAVFICLLAWFSLALQLYIMLTGRAATGLSVFQTIGRFLGYFTILTNLLVAVSLTISLVGSMRGANFFSNSSTVTAIATYIVVVGLGYNILLRHLWQPQGSQALADELLHVAVPLSYFLYWLFFIPRFSMKWKVASYWLLYPFFYLVLALIRGAIDGFYPYFFIDQSKLGLLMVLRNAAGLFAVFVVVSLLFIRIKKK